MELDAFDLKLLGLLQANNRRTNEDLGDEVNLSPTAVSRRVKSMRDAGVIAADVSVIDQRYAGPLLSAIIMCRLDRAETETWLRFCDYLRASPEVGPAYSLTGDYNLAFEIATRTVAEHDAFLSRVVDAFPTVRNLTTYVVLNQVKRSLALPVSLLRSSPS